MCIERHERNKDRLPADDVRNFASGDNIYGFLLDQSLRFIPDTREFRMAHAPPRTTVKKASYLAASCAKTCGFCPKTDRCVEQCDKMLRGDCKGKECGCEWMCPSWAHPKARCNL